jgi:glycosyltransferase involved in cell wall biosynthesis
MRNVVLVADIQHEFFPEFFAPEDLAERRRRFGDAISRADYVCAVSDFTRCTLIDRLAVPPEKVITLRLAAAPLFSPERPGDEERRLEAFALRGVEYLLFPAHTWRHKNHQAALEALRILRDRHGLRPLLICTGAAREAQPAIEEQLRRHDLQGQVRFVGYCVPEDLAAFYRNAAALVFPSLFEGFGMPVLEAMASGCPVVCSDAGSLPEVAGPAALLVDPRDHEGLAEALRRILCEEGLAATLRAHGLERAAGFTWRRHTIDLLSLLHRVHVGLRRA